MSAEPLVDTAYGDDDGTSSHGGDYEQQLRRSPPGGGGGGGGKFKDRNKWSRCKGVCLWLLVAAVVVFAGLAVFLPIFAWNMFAEQLKLTTLFNGPDAQGYPGWADSAYDANRTFSMYVFEVLNPDGFVYHAEKLHVVERGPFVYNMRVRKLNATFDTVEDTATYREWTTYEFDPAATSAATGGRYDSDNGTKFTVVDLFFWGMAAQTGEAAWYLLNFERNDTEKMFTQRTVRELKNGYVAELGQKFPGLQPNLPPDGLEPSTVRLGTTNTSQIGQYVTWRGQKELRVKCPWGKTELDELYCPQGEAAYDNSNSGACCDVNGTLPPVPVWQWPVPGGPSTPAEIPATADVAPPNEVTGTDGNQFAFPDPGDSIAIFADPLNRHLPMQRVQVGDTSYVQDIALDRYEIPRDAAGTQNASVTSYDAAYYMLGPQGVQNGSTVQQGAPVYITCPHMWDTSPEATDRVVGQEPSQEKHQTFLGVEPHSGTTFFSHQRIQLNVLVEPKTFPHGKPWFTGMMSGSTYVPLAWFDEAGQIQQPFADQFRDGLTLVQDIAYYGGGGCGGLAAGCLVGVVVLALERRRFYRRRW